MILVKTLPSCGAEPHACNCVYGTVLLRAKFSLITFSMIITHTFTHYTYIGTQETLFSLSKSYSSMFYLKCVFGGTNCIICKK